MSENQNTTQSFNLAIPIKVKPYQHQKTAFLFALKVMGFITDEDCSLV